MCSCSLVYCNGTATCTIGQLIFAESEENVMWDPTANTSKLSCLSLKFVLILDLYIAPGNCFLVTVDSFMNGL